MRKGFTLIEMVAVVIILAIIASLALPPILNQINEKKKELSDAMTTIIKDAGRLYIGDNLETHPAIEGNIYCVTLQTLVNQEYLKDPVMDPVTNQEVELTKHVKVTRTANQFEYEITSTCEERKLH